MKVIYTVAQFRKDTREALNTVEAGEPILIIRHGKRFIVTLDPAVQLKAEGKHTDNGFQGGNRG